MIFFCLSNKALYSLQFALLKLVNNYYCDIFFCISYSCCNLRYLLFLKPFLNVCRIILTNSFYLLFNDRKLDRVICFCFLNFCRRKERNNYNFLFWRLLFPPRNSVLQAQGQDTFLLFRCDHFRFNHTRKFETSLNQNWSTIVSTS